MRELGRARFRETRYVGDRKSMIVHDTWNKDSDGCCLGDLADRGDAVHFEPDSLGQAFDEGFDYCDHCLGATEPDAPQKERSSATAH